MISSNFYKLVEYCLLPKLIEHITISPMQFGYREGTSTLLATTLLKETLHPFKNEDSQVCASFVDLNKAFERVDHKIMIDILISKDVPMYIANIIETILNLTKVKIDFNGFSSTEWTISIGVRYGGVLFSFLFSAYIDHLLVDISMQPVGLRLGASRIGIQAYAVDMVLPSPYASSLQYQLDCLYRLYRLFLRKQN